jgi:hypothetical protein
LQFQNEKEGQDRLIRLDHDWPGIRLPQPFHGEPADQMLVATAAITRQSW